MSIHLKTEKLRVILFIAVYSIACLLTSKNIDGNIFYYNSLLFQLIKTLSAFVLVYLATIINKSNIDKINSYVSIYTKIVAVVYFIDNYTLQLSGDVAFFRLWWLSLIHFVFLAYYLALATFKGIDFKRYTTKALKGYSVLYAISFIVVFLRPISDNLTYNFTVGKGTLSYIRYLIEYPYDSEILFLVIGNVIFFIPIAFLLEAYFPKIKGYQQIIIGLIIPFIVEGYQLIFKCGDVDIDDIIMNFSGFLIGFLFLLLQNRIKKKQQDV